MGPEYILETKNITKSFPGVTALNNVSLKLKKGEVHGLVGENGAGKSTLIKIIAGYHQPDEGRIFFNGTEKKISNPKISNQLGIQVIYQELNSFNELTIAENIFIGNQKNISEKKFVDWNKLNTKAKEVLSWLGVEIDPRKKVKNLSVADKQIIEIARAIYKNSKIIIMDEPTAALSNKATKKLFEIINNCQNQGVTILYISHRLEEIFGITDRVTVLRNGKKIETITTTATNKDEVVKFMVGEDLKRSKFEKDKSNKNDNVLSVKNIEVKDVLHNISFELHGGEVLGIYGLVGSGKAELSNALFGILSLDKGEFYLNNQKIIINHPLEARNLGLGLIPFERKTEGLALEKDVKDNITVTNIEGLGKRFFINNKIEKQKVNKWIDELNIQTPNIFTKVKTLSGGNQQKIVVAKWLESKTNFLILNEPTRGIDVGAKEEIYHLIDEQRKKGKGIIIISSELPEILSMSDRILVMNKGTIKAEFSAKEATKEKLVSYAV